MAAVRRFYFTGMWRNESWCWLEIVRKKAYVAMIATQPDDESGSLIANLAEDLATRLREKVEVLPSKMLWIEHYPADALRKNHPETWYRMDFAWVNGWAEDLRWIQLAYDEVGKKLAFEF